MLIYNTVAQLCAHVQAYKMHVCMQSNTSRIHICVIVLLLILYVSCVVCFDLKEQASHR